jgi:(2Fe-2S) ferredoxin
MRYPFEKLFLVCTGPRCSVERVGPETGAVIQAELKDLNKKLGRKPTVRVCQVSCLDLCDHGPNMVVEPDGTVYSHLTRETARAAYLGEMGDGERQPHLELTEEELQAYRK